MAATVKCAVYARHILRAQVQCVKIVNARHYPRWTHRRPAYVVEHDCSEAEKERWKLNVEREIVKDSRSQKQNIETNLSSLPGSYHETIDQEKQESFSCALLKENFADVSHETRERFTENARPDIENKGMNRKQIYPEDASNDKKFSTSVRDTKNVLDGFSLKTLKGSGKPKQPKTLDKLKILTEKQLDTMVKMRESAQKLGVPVFTDLGVNDTVLSQYLTNVKSKKTREKNQKILLEGKRLIKDALDAGVLPEVVFFTRIKDLKDLNLPHEGVKIFKITYKKLSLWSEVATSQGVMAILKTPKVIQKSCASLPLTVICDNVRDPGNLGTILRTCAGVGCRKVILTKGCVDLWDPRVLRAGAGAHFRVPVHRAENWDDLSNEMDENSFVCIAESRVARDSERHQEGKSDMDTEIESDTDNDMELQQSELDMIPVVPYYGLNYASLPSVVLIVGGETLGISPEAYQYVSKASGLRVNIPLSNNVDSLNCSTALSIIAFEIKKQYLIKVNASDPEEKEHLENSKNSKASMINT